MYFSAAKADARAGPAPDRPCGSRWRDAVDVVRGARACAPHGPRRERRQPERQPHPQEPLQLLLRVSLALPRARRDALYAVYAFCRTVDDVADLGRDPAAQRAGLGALARGRGAVLRAGAGPRAPDRAASCATPCAPIRSPARRWRRSSTGARWICSACATSAPTISIRTATAWPRRWVSAASRSSATPTRAPASTPCTSARRCSSRTSSATSGPTPRSGRVYLPQQDLQAFGVSEDDLVAGRYGDRFVAPDGAPGRARPRVLRARPRAAYPGGRRPLAGAGRDHGAHLPRPARGDRGAALPGLRRAHHGARPAQGRHRRRAAGPPRASGSTDWPRDPRRGPCAPRVLDGAGRIAPADLGPARRRPRRAAAAPARLRAVRLGHRQDRGVRHARARGARPRGGRRRRRGRHWRGRLRSRRPRGRGASRAVRPLSLLPARQRIDVPRVQGAPTSIPAASRSTCACRRANVRHATFRIPDHLTDEEASFVEPLACCLRAVERARVRAGRHRRSWSASARSAACSSSSSSARAPPWSASIRSRDRAALALSLGAACGRAGEAAARGGARAERGPRRRPRDGTAAAPTCCRGRPAGRARAGRCTIFAGGPGDALPLPLGTLYHRELTLTVDVLVVAARRWPAPSGCWPPARWRSSGLITHRLPLERLAEGVDLMRRREALKVYVTP